MESLIVGVCGGTGSGKSTLARNLYNALKEEAILIGMDNYYKDNSLIPFSERIKINYDQPESIDVNLLKEHLLALKSGKDIRIPIYDYAKHTREKETIFLESKPIIIVEGILLFAIPEIKDLLNLKIFVDVDADERAIRRIVRDVKKRGRTLESVVKQYRTTVKPMHDKYVEPYKLEADIIVKDGGRDEKTYLEIAEKIRNIRRFN